MASSPGEHDSIPFLQKSSGCTERVDTYVGGAILTCTWTTNVCSDGSSRRCSCRWKEGLAKPTMMAWGTQSNDSRVWWHRSSLRPPKLEDVSRAPLAPSFFALPTYSLHLTSPHHTANAVATAAVLSSSSSSLPLS